MKFTSTTSALSTTLAVVVVVVAATSIDAFAPSSPSFKPTPSRALFVETATGGGSSKFAVTIPSPSTTTVVNNRRQRLGLTILNEKEDDKSSGGGATSSSSGGGGGFSLSNLFGGNKDDSGTASGAGTNTLLRGAGSGGAGGKLAPHPSARKHISPLNRLGPDPQPPTSALRDPLPVHPDVRSGTLPNGLPYVILPNKSPPGRFEAHLQVFSGSADELESQQGIAHLTEHVAYMGSRKRELLFGTGSQTNGTGFPSCLRVCCCSYLGFVCLCVINAIFSLFKLRY